MPESGYQVLSSEREEEVRFQFTPNEARSECSIIIILILDLSSDMLYLKTYVLKV